MRKMGITCTHRYGGMGIADRVMEWDETNGDLTHWDGNPLISHMHQDRMSKMSTH